jgi:hypothetical protein
MAAPGVATFAVHRSPDGKSFLYATSSHGETILSRQPWKDGKITGPAQVALKLPFAFRQDYAGNAYDFSPDLSTIVYASPGGQANLYLLSRKATPQFDATRILVPAKSRILLPRVNLARFRTRPSVDLMLRPARSRFPNADSPG